MKGDVSMDELFELIFRNPFLILLIIGWLFATFREKPKKGQQDQRQQRQQPSRQTRPQRQSRRQPSHSGRSSTHSEPQGTPLGRVEVEQRPVVTSHESFEQPVIEDQQQEQLQQLKNRLGAHVADFDDMEDLSNVFQQNEQHLPHVTKEKMKQSVTRSELGKRFNKQGLVESVIMAEVLGKPRAKRMNHRNNL